jgi:hypothetical protein
MRMIAIEERFLLRELLGEEGVSRSAPLRG